MIESSDVQSARKPEELFGKFLKGRKTPDNSTVIADTVYARLRDAILNGEIRPGKRLIENELSEWLSVSRTPIREALVCLEKDGLVERKNGWLVHEHTPAEIKARLECRMMIEGYAARLASARRTEADLEMLRNYSAEMKKIETTGMEYYQVNDHFHQTIVDAARNPTLNHLYSQTKLNYCNLGVPILYGVDLNQKMLAHHDEIIDALVTGDGDLAETISRQHVQSHMELTFKFIKVAG